MLEVTVRSLKKIVREVSENSAETSVIASVLIVSKDATNFPEYGTQDESARRHKLNPHKNPCDDTCMCHLTSDLKLGRARS